MPRHRLRLVLAIAMLALQPGCGKASSDGLAGNWRIDMGATLDQARALGATPADIEGVRRAFDGGMLTITSSTISLSLADAAAASTLAYHLESTAGGCSMLQVQGSAASQRFCVSGAQLKVHDPATPLVVVYRRAWSRPGIAPARANAQGDRP